MREFPTPQEILNVFEREPGKTYRLRELVVELGLRSSQARELKSALKDLARQRHIVCLKKSHFTLAGAGAPGSARRPPPRSAPPTLPIDLAGEERLTVSDSSHRQPPTRSRAINNRQLKKPQTLENPPRRALRARGANVVSGRLIGHRDGYGFVVPDVPLAGTDLDIYISPEAMGSAMHGDRVEVQVLRAKPDGRVEGHILRAIDRAQKTVVGQFHCGQQYNYVLPFDQRIPFEIVIPPGHEWPARDAPGTTPSVSRRTPLVGEEGTKGWWAHGGLRSRDRQFGGEPPRGACRGGSPKVCGSSEVQDDTQDLPAQAGSELETQKPSNQQSVTPDWIGGSRQSLDGLIVDVELTSFPRPAPYRTVQGSAAHRTVQGPATLPRGRVIEILGRRDEFGVDVEIIIRKYHLPHRFPADVLDEASAVARYIPEHDLSLPHRRDFRGLPIVTIDGETAKDFDDAVLVERLPSGNYLLHVHIADVAHYVRPGSALDREARLRGTSVYFPDRAVPMLPLELSNGICSLNPHVDRLVMSVLMQIDPRGQIVGYEILPGIIRSAARLTYTAVRDILSGKGDAIRGSAALGQLCPMMEELALILYRRREQRGSIDFDLPEPMIEFDESGRMVGITRSERNVAHRIIEEFMLAANEVVAGYLEARGIPSLYRIHEKPDPKKVREFEEIAATFGYSLGVELPAAQRFRTSRRDPASRHHPRFFERFDGKDLEISPRHYQQLTRRLEGKPEERILSYLMLRSLRQARYSEENVGHFALATGTYTHFTSPIRRYPDLIVHRILKAALEREGGAARVVERAATRRGTPAVEPRGRAPLGPMGGAFILPQELHALGVASSEAERRAADAERELVEWKKVSFMAQHVGDEFDALIISLTKYGFFVELTDLFVEGFVSLATLADDYYVYRERQRAIVGQRTLRLLHLGEHVRVRLDRLDPSGNKLEFSIPANS